MSTPLSELGENAVLKRLLCCLPDNGSLIVGPGDDCAVVARNDEWDTLLKTDVVVESVHFTPDTAPELIGRKALARALSDIAAMGGIPEHALITLLIHPSRPVELLERIYGGISRLASACGVSVAGGETSSLPYDGLVINVALTGRVERGKAVLRSGARAGDILCVSGRLGGSFPSARHLTFEPALKLARFLLENNLAPTAMMDLSDGLATDLPRLAEASGCGYQLTPASIPCHPGCSVQQALTDGEDYELLMTFAPETAQRLSLIDLPSPITPIGKIVPRKRDILGNGWQHFSA
ncbi:MAG: thiamine-phosphate kinase [Akkermansia sp.]|nr:thiamine-phosphate kinase [Akkermansia sp.]